MPGRPHRLHPLVSRVLRNVTRRCGVRPGERLLVAVSGGADSVALLALLAELAPRLDLALEIAHFDHALRPDSTEDARWVAALAGGLGLRVHVERWTSPRRGEAAARAARYAFLVSTARARSCAATAVAHQLEDRIETMLLRLARGTGPRGLAGMTWRRPGPVAIVRPLLDVPREAIRSWLGETGRTWREDHTNAALEPLRNRVRHQVLPALEAAFGRDWSGRWSDCLDDLEKLQDHVAAAAAALLEAARVPAAHPTCDLAVLRAAPEPVLCAAILSWIDAAMPAGSGLSRTHVGAAARLVHEGRSGQRTCLPGGATLVLEQGDLVLLHAAAQRAAALSEAPGAAVAPFGHLAIVEVPGDAARPEIEQAPPAAPGPRPRDLPPDGEALVAAEALVPPLRLRGARPGDRVRLLGAPGTRQLVDVFQSRRVPRRLRALWPVVEDERGIVWVPGIGLAERGRIGPDTLRALRLRWRPAPGPAGVAQARPTT